MNLKIDLPVVFQPLREPARFKAYASGRGAGKSWAFARVLVLLALTRTENLFLCCREIQKSIQDSVYRLLRDQIGKLGLNQYFRITNNNIICTHTGTQFIFYGLRNESAAENIKSLEGTNICWVEEAHTLSQESLDILIPTIREKGSEIWFSLNPRYKGDPVWQMFFENTQTPPDSIIRFISWRDNPFFPVTLYNDMQFDKAVSHEKYQHIWEGGLRTLGGSLLKRVWFERWPVDRQQLYDYLFISLDTAYTSKTYSDYSVMQLWGATREHLDLLDSWRGKWEFNDLLINTKEFYSRHARPDSKFRGTMAKILIESKASGYSLIQMLKKEGFGVKAFKPGNQDKVARVNLITPYIRNGQVRLPPDDYAYWVEDFLSEISEFSEDMKHPHDDQIDAMSQAVLEWGRRV